MPCRTDDYEPKVSQSSYDRLKAEADKVTALLCATLRYIDSNKSADGIYAYTEGLYAWWQAHQEIDRSRVEKEVLSAVKGLSLKDLEALAEKMKKDGRS